MAGRTVWPTLVAVLALATACGGHEDVQAPDWVVNLARHEAADEGEDSPEVTFAACGPSTCIVRMRGEFRCRDCSRPPGIADPTGIRLDVEISLDRRDVETRALYAGD